MAFAPPPPPKTALGYYRMLAPTASVRVSPLCLGGMNFGDAWYVLPTLSKTRVLITFLYRKDFMGECGKGETEKILDYFYECGGNFIDTSNNYQKEESEQWIGEWMKKRGIRDQMVIATKFTT
jgi:aryl-alcohol dehydrogenase-like predicted oxidoreductase